MSQSDREISSIVEASVRRATGVHTLRLIRKFIDAENEQGKANQRAVKRIVLGFVISFAAVIALVTINSKSIPRAEPKSSLTQVYATAVSAQIERYAHANYPAELKAKKIYGTVVVLVTVASDGKLEKVSISRTSGNSELDGAVIDLVKKVDSFPPFSGEMKQHLDIIEITKSYSFVDEKIDQTK